MKLEEIYNLAIERGAAADPRGKEEVEKFLAKKSKEWEELSQEEKEDFDREELTNPYNDTRILFGEGDDMVSSVLAGIDISVGEVMLADRLKEKGEPIDLLLAHHPGGRALAGLYEVMHLQEEILFKLGVPINISEGLLEQRIGEVERNLLPVNHMQAVDAARLLNIPMMCAHTPADNLVVHFLDHLFTEHQPETLGDIIQILKKIPEYKYAVAQKFGPRIVVGDKDKRAGKIFVDMTGGTEGSEDAYAKLAQAGVGTIVGMHMGEKHRKEAKKNHINVIIAGHYSSDSLGMNLLLDDLEDKGVKVNTCSGLFRVKRK